MRVSAGKAIVTSTSLMASPTLAVKEKLSKASLIKANAKIIVNVFMWETFFVRRNKAMIIPIKKWARISRGSQPSIFVCEIYPKNRCKG
jgi:hypothetical protein